MTVLSGQKILADHVAALQNPPRALLRQTVAQSLTNSAFTALTFGTEDIDSHNGHSTSTNTSRYTVQTGYDGDYQLSGTAAIAAAAGGGRGTRWFKNGTAINGSETMVGNVNPLNQGQPAVTIIVSAVAGDYFELAAWQDSGGAINSAVVAPAQSTASIRLVAAA